MAAAQVPPGMPASLAAAFEQGQRDADATGPVPEATAHRLRVLILGTDYAQPAPARTAHAA